MRANIYRLRVKKVADVMVMAALKQDVDSKKSMELLHQRFGHMGMSTVKALANKHDVGIEINAKGLSSFECVACAASKAKRMTHSRIPVRKSEPLETLMMDICSLNELTVDGASMFLFVIRGDEVQVGLPAQEEERRRVAHQGAAQQTGAKIS